MVAVPELTTSLHTCAWNAVMLKLILGWDHNGLNFVMLALESRLTKILKTLRGTPAQPAEGLIRLVDTPDTLPQLMQKLDQ